MKFHSKTEQILYWIYKAPSLYEFSSNQQDTTVTTLLQDMQYAHEFAGKQAREAQEAFTLFAEKPENYLRYFQEMACLRCDLVADLENVHLFKITPVQAVNKLRKVQGAYLPKTFYADESEYPDMAE